MFDKIEVQSTTYYKSKVAQNENWKKIYLGLKNTANFETIQ